MKNPWTRCTPAWSVCVGALGLLWLGCVPAQGLGFAADPTLLAKTALGDERGSAAVGVWREGRAAYGFSHNGGSKAPDDVAPSDSPDAPQQLYEIGSISKVFTGLLLAQAVERGDLALEDSLGTLLQGKVAMPPETASITLRQLITHSACVPREPPGFPGYGAENPFAGHDRAAMRMALSTLKLRQPPPCAGAYSNFGVGIVGEVLSERYGKPWDVLVGENITGPLGMHDTVQKLDDKAVRMAPPYNHMATAPLWDFQALSGAGALRSTAADMLIFSRAILAGAAGPLGPAAQRLLTPLGAYMEGEIGYAVLIRGPSGHRTYSHGGVTAGFRSLWLIAPDTQEAMVALTSSAHAQPGKLFIGVTADRYPVTTARTEIDAARLAEYAGVFRADKDTAYVFVPQDGKLYRRPTGGQFRPLVPAGPDTFVDPAWGVQYVFRREGNAVVGVDYTQGGGGRSALRTSEVAPSVAVAPAPQDYVGRYHLQRMLRRNLDFDVKAEGAQLAVRSSNWPRQPVYPVAGQPDRFTYEKIAAELQFERDAQGRVVALVLHEGARMRMPRVPD